MIDAPVTCAVVRVSDGDTFTCASGVKVRIGGIESNERRGGCHILACPTMLHAQAKATVERLVLHRTLKCQPVGRSWSRIVASCTLAGRDIGCQIIAIGAGVRWDSWWTRYSMRPCGG